MLVSAPTRPLGFDKIGIICMTLLIKGFRYMDTACVGICYSQKLHFYKGTAYSCGYAESGKDAEGMGLGYWETEAERIEVEEAEKRD